LRAIFTIGIAWGAVTLLVGLAGSFVLNSIHLFANLVGLFSVLSILPITIAAVWKPKTSAALLVLSFLLFECGALPDEGLHTVLQIALRVGLPTILCHLAMFTRHLFRLNADKNHKNLGMNPPPPSILVSVSPTLPETSFGRL
jgi:hypothetical protein